MRRAAMTRIRPVYGRPAASALLLAAYAVAVLFAPAARAQTEPAEGPTPQPAPAAQPAPVPASGSGPTFFGQAEADPAPAEQAPPAGEDRGDETARERDEEEHDHTGMFSRLSIGIGYGLYGGSGQADPVPGVEVIEDPSGGGLALNLSLDWGLGIIENLALHIGPLFEFWLADSHDSAIDGLYLFGLGGGVSYYFMPFDLYLTGQIRWIGLLFYLPDAPCEFLGTGKLSGYDGIGLSLSVGKEWFPNQDEGGIGIGLQLNWAYLDEAPGINYFSIMLVPTLTRF
jgi:hypothetical protein